ncbi:pyrroloquinoline quinone biosynthesis peptide chaperone PqqD [Actinomadura violacea]|uniref:Pyrroloquinoline quinone biosynthesis peptide chaperone PqqD n=1 Tax=Actinomadura violacea TaxID=2819934 RepID=A0ABS3S3H7_9ACTN|nr:pyrroloquinoline quinone biosynthesis peptide chaperone PqqD [Actinomadura violacea]MBO2463565.1 pyrroloquinoline quinone biosynthesis peptide chaperone PqqD [Actinomadura violacea]
MRTEPAPPMAATGRPALVPAVMLRYDRVRRADLLLMPERAVLLSPEAGRILRLCDGHRTIADIIAALAVDHPHAPLERDVPEFIDRVRAEGWLR